MTFKVGDRIRATERAWASDGGIPLEARPVREVVAANDEGFSFKGTLFSYADPDFVFSVRYDEEASLDFERVEPPVQIGLDALTVSGAVDPARIMLKPEMQESILSEALRITDGARQRDYGSAKTNHQRIALFWKVWDICHLASDETIDQALAVLRAEFENHPTDDSEAGVAMKMILLKIARHANTPKRDNLVDMAGYARCLSRIDGFEE